MTGPSASGSEKGRPSSMTSAPQASKSRSASAVVARSGSPAVMYGMNAVCNHARHTKAHWEFVRTRKPRLQSMDDMSAQYTPCPAPWAWTWSATTVGTACPLAWEAPGQAAEPRRQPPWWRPPQHSSAPPASSRPTPPPASWAMTADEPPGTKSTGRSMQPWPRKPLIVASG